MEMAAEEKEGRPQKENAVKTEKRFVDRIKSRRVIETIILVAIVLGAAMSAYYFLVLQNRIFTDKAEVSAPLIDLGVKSPSILKSVLVKEGDRVHDGTPVARLDNDYIAANTGGIIVSINDKIGKLFMPGEPIVTMINPQALRVTARIGENNGLSDIRAGQKADFTVDAFGSKTFSGIVDEIGRTALESSVVFSISDKREEKEFVIKIKYDTQEYPELLNGMSARVWIYK